MKKHLLILNLLILFSNSYAWPQNTYYVDNQNTNANDSNSGTEDAPFKTIQAAINQATIGSIILISEGTYREQLSNFKDGLTLQAEAGEKVIISALAEVVENQNGAGVWTNHSGNIWKIQLDASYMSLEPPTLPAASGSNPVGRNYGKTLVLIDNTRQNEARWPNTDNTTFFKRGTEDSPEDFAFTTAGDFVGVVSGERFACEYDVPTLTGDWTGGFIQFAGGFEWWGEWGYITSATTTKLNFEFHTASLWARTYNKPHLNDPFFLWGKLHALDYENEFFLDVYGTDGSPHTLYVYGDPRNKTVESKTREWVIHGNNASNVTFKDITFVGGVIETFSESANVTFDGVEAEFCGRYNMNGWTKSSFFLRGPNNKVINSDIYNTPGVPIIISNSDADNALIENNVIYNTGFIMQSGDGIQISGDPTGTNILQNTIFNASVTGISASNLGGGSVKFNRVYNISNQQTDLSGINAFNGGDAGGGEIAYNIVQDVVAYKETSDPVIKHFGGKGIRLDAGAAPKGNFNFNIHHNIVYNTTSSSLVVWPNSDAQRAAAGLSAGQNDGNRVFNNTVDDNIATLDRLSATGQYYKGTEFKNNITLGKFTYQGAESSPPGSIVETNLLSQNTGSDVIAGNLTGEADFVDATNFDFRLSQTSQALDAGVEIPPFTDDFQGSAPDMGALEDGKMPFVAGATLREEDLDDLTINCVVDNNGVLICTFNGLPIGRLLPEDFTIKTGNNSINADCFNLYDSETHLAISNCDLGNTQLSGDSVEVSLDGTNFTKVPFGGEGGSEELLNQLNPFNVLTPNGDGQNDTWLIENFDLIANGDYTIKIFTKTGQVVFETIDYQQDWDGTTQSGKLLPEDIYYYVIMIEGSKNARTGYITLIR